MILVHWHYIILLFACWVIYYDYLSSADFFKLIFKKKFFQENHQSVKQFESRSGLTYSRA